MLPVTAVAMLESIELLAAATSNFAERDGRRGLVATERGPALVEQGLMLATALAPVIGYDDAAALAKEAFKSGKTIRELALERGMAPTTLDRLLDPAAMTEPGLGRRSCRGLIDQARRIRCGGSDAGCDRQGEPRPAHRQPGGRRRHQHRGPGDQDDLCH